MKNKLSKAIDKSQLEVNTEIRDYIGASSIGSECLRKIWYQFKGFEGDDVSSRIRRTWYIGKNLEGLILDWLDDAGFEIARTWYDLKSKYNPYFKGHVDSILTKNGEAQAIIEIKTAKDASFKIFVNKGLKIWNQQYYAQVQSYMGMSGINSAYILVLNKDSSELSDEYIEFDSNYYEQLEKKALLISKAENPPPRINGSPLWYLCKMCQFNKVCHTK